MLGVLREFGGGKDEKGDRHVPGPPPNTVIRILMLAKRFGSELMRLAPKFIVVY